MPVRIARTGAEIRQAAKEGTPALVYAVEGGHVLRSDESNVDRLAALGVRYLTIVHFVHNRIGGAAAVPFGLWPVREICDIRDYELVAEALLRGGFSSADIELIMGENLVTTFERFDATLPRQEAILKTQ